MRILRAADYRVMPWKNGGGTTTEIMVSPDGAGLDDFDWRISMARVEGSGPFSSFAGIDRTLSVLEGEGIALDVTGLAPVHLTRLSSPFSFPADVATSAELLAGAITDLNVMSRRDRMRHIVQRITLSDAIELDPQAAMTIVLPLDGNMAVTGAETGEIGPLDALLLERGSEKPRLAPVGRCTLFLIRIDEASSNH